MDKETIKDLVNNYFNLDITRNTRKRPYVEARAYYFKLMRKHTPLSLELIGKEVNRDHASVLHGIKILYYWMLHDTRIKNNYKTLEVKLKSIKEQSKIIDIDENILIKYVSLQNTVKEQDQLITELSNELEELKVKTEKRERFYSKYGFYR